jgi:superfamily I DNA/RNA helicase
MLWGAEEEGEDGGGTNGGGQRIWSIIDDLMEYDTTFPFKLRFGAKRVINKIASLGKAYAVNPDAPDAANQLKAIIDKYQIDMDLSTEWMQVNEDFSPMLIEKTIEVLRACLPAKSGNPKYNTMRDHDDTLWYAALMNDKLIWPKYDIVLADEVQDFNKCQQIMLQQLCKNGARILPVGDPNQAIYQFRGADSEAFQNIYKIVDQCGQMAGRSAAVVQSLPTNYRSGTKIIEYVNENTHVKNLQAGKKHKGLVTEGVKQEDALASIEQEWIKNGRILSMPTTFISYGNKPLVNTAMGLIRQDIDFQLLGRDLSNELTKHVQKITGRGPKERIIPIEQLSRELYSYLESVKEKWKNKISKQATLKAMEDTTEALGSILSHLQEKKFTDDRLRMQIRNSKDFSTYVKKRFGGVDLNNAKDAQKMSQVDPRSYVMLTTSHKSKGLEFNRVFILEPGAFSGGKKDSDIEILQKKNAWYVALTRAEIELHVLADSTKKA